MKRLEINIPFSGFYNSLWSAEVDRVIEQESEWSAEREQEEVPDAVLRVTEEEFCEVLVDSCDYSAAYRQIAEDYTDAFGEVIHETLGIDLDLKFADMSSPRYYNFETDRIFATIPLTVAEELFAASAEEEHETLRRLIADRFTSYDGFRSNYTNEADVWLAKPLTEWDHNELGTLLLAAMERDQPAEGWDIAVYYAMNEAFFHAVQEAVDWQKVEEKITDLRAEKAKEAAEDDPEFEPTPPRCDRTMELFT